MQQLVALILRQVVAEFGLTSGEKSNRLLDKRCGGDLPDMARMKQRSLTPTLPKGYATWLQQLKSRIRLAQVKAALSANREMVVLYWEIGKGIMERQESAGWGDAVIQRLSADLRREFPEMMGFSARNLWDMRRFFEAYRNRQILRQLVAEIPWGHNLVLLNSVKSPAERIWYARQTIANGWSRAVLVHQIETGLHRRQAGALKANNFKHTLPAKQSELVAQTLKDPYVFDFLQVRKQAKERELQRALLERLKDFLLELGAGFALLGSEYGLEVDGRDFRVDLLFFHHRLRCLFAIDLKMRDFEPEFAGKMNFYLSALDAQVRHPDDQPSVGLILCKGKGRTVVEYALRDLRKPIGVAEYKLTDRLPKPLAKLLPAPAELERVLSEKD